MAPRESTIIKTLNEVKELLEKEKKDRALNKVTKLLEKIPEKESKPKPPNKYNDFVKKFFKENQDNNKSATEKMQMASKAWKEKHDK